MVFESRTISLGKGRVSSVCIDQADSEGITIIMSNSGVLIQKKIDKNFRISTVKSVLNYADDAAIFDGKVVARYGGVLQYEYTRDQTQDRVKKENRVF